MSVLPIVERELRVATRRGSTYWMRFISAGLVFAFWFFLMLMAPAALPIARGQMLFLALSGVMFAFCLLAGPFLTADSVSRERREGTLGLLFLTDLKAYDIALGKLLATSLPAIYGLLAVLPLQAYSILIGGVTPGEVLRMSLVLVTTLAFSLCLGLLVSVYSRETRQAIVGSAFALLLFCTAPPVAVAIGHKVFKAGWSGVFGWPSPLWALGHAFDKNYTRSGAWQYWGSITTLLLMTLAALVWAAFRAAEAWHEKRDAARPAGALAELRTWRFAKPKGTWRAGLLEREPVCWLATRDRLPRLLAWGVLAASLFFWMIFAVASFFAPKAFAIAFIITCLFHHALKWLVTIEASRRLSDERQNGTLELLLVSPVSVEDLVRGQLRALRRIFGGPVKVAAAMNLYLLCWLPIGIRGFSLGMDGTIVAGEILIGGTVLLLLDLWTLGWVGMWMGMVAKHHHRAVLAALARVILVPWLAILFLVLLTMGGLGLNVQTAVALIPGWFGLAAVLAWTFKARAKVGLFSVLRELAGDNTLKASHPAFLDEPMRMSAPSAQVG